jgi:hypothetical protein
MDQYEQIFGTKPKEYTSTLLKSDNPEIYTTDKLDQTGIKIYQSMNGSLHWTISLGQFYIQMEMMTMSQLQTAPRKGHLERLKHIYGYLCRFKSVAIRVSRFEPAFSTLPVQEFGWAEIVYGKV